jgi:hypothetical protein
MGRVHITPDPFTVVPYEVPVIAGLVEEAAALVGFPPGVEIDLDIDEDLPHPLVGTASDVEGGRAKLWMSGGNLESTHHSRQFSEPNARADLVQMLLRANDRLSREFASAPPDIDLTLAERAAWDVWAQARAGALGIPVRVDRMRYDFRLQHGFSDAADAAFDRLWDAKTLSWDGLREICKETGAADRPVSKIPGDLLRRKG